jgi:hypothetical protein
MHYRNPVSVCVAVRHNRRHCRAQQRATVERSACESKPQILNTDGARRCRTNTVETRFGTLWFFDGVPDQASTEKIYDNLDFQRAVQAYLSALPVVNQAANRSGILATGSANTTVPIWKTMVDSRTVELTANDNTPYTWFWIDLRNGPLVIEAPPKVLGLVDDIWYHWNGDIGFTGPDHGEGGRYLLLPPGYKAEVPQGYFVIRPGSYSVWAVWRSFLVDGNPNPGVDMVKMTLKVYPLSQASNPPALNSSTCPASPFNMVGPADFRFWEMLNQVVQDEPTDTVDVPLQARMASMRAGVALTLIVQHGFEENGHSRWKDNTHK